MTQATKHYVDLNDLIATALECKNCHATLSVRTDAAKTIIPKACPSCEYPWFTSFISQPGIGEHIRGLYEQLIQIRTSLEATGSLKVGFSLKLELPPSVSSPAASSRDA